MAYWKRWYTIVRVIGCLVPLVLAQNVGNSVWAETSDIALVQAIMAEDVEGARQALEAGANPNLVVEGYARIVVQSKARTALIFWELAFLPLSAIVEHFLFPFGLGVEFHATMILVSRARALESTPEVAAAHQQAPIEHVPLVFVALQQQPPAQYELVELLLRYGADVNAIMPDDRFDEFDAGWTALIAAILQDTSDMVTLLLRYGADINRPISDGRYAGDSALFLATARHSPETIALLTSAGATPLNADQQDRAFRIRKEWVSHKDHYGVRCGDGGCYEKRDLPYELYTALVKHIPLPQDAQHIDWFFFAARMFGGVNYEFVQAEVTPEDVDLPNLATACFSATWEDVVLLKNVPFTTEGFAHIFHDASGETSLPPQWWSDGLAMQEETQNVVMVGNDHRYGDGQGYGRGCWAFYHEPTQVVRVFWWSQQWLSVTRFCTAFHIPSCQQTETALAEERGHVSPSPCSDETPLEHLQHIALGDIKLFGILVGDLGESARIRTADGIECTIEVGTRLGRHEGEVVDIQAHRVVVRQRFYEKEESVKETETSLSLVPPEESKSSWIRN